MTNLNKTKDQTVAEINQVLEWLQRDIDGLFGSTNYEDQIKLDRAIDAKLELIAELNSL